MTGSAMSSVSTPAAGHDQRCVALLYHHIGQASAGAYPDLTLSPREFERQIRWLARRGYTGIRPADWFAWYKSGSSLPPKPILITFDDAYADIAEHALPILRQFGFGAAVFVATGRIGQTSDWDEGLGYPALPLMSAAQIRYWAGEGIEFGAHSRMHPNLTKLSREALGEEVAASCDDLAVLLDHPVIAFAYPFGAYNNTVHGAVQSSFGLAFTADSGFNSRQTDPHLLRRIIIKPKQSMLAFSLLVRLGEHWRSKLALRTRLKRALGMR